MFGVDDDVADVLADHFFARHAEHARADLVDLQVSAVVVRHEDAVGGLLDDLPVAVAGRGRLAAFVARRIEGRDRLRLLGQERDQLLARQVLVGRPHQDEASSVSDFPSGAVLPSDFATEAVLPQTEPETRGEPPAQRPDRACCREMLLIV